MGDLSRTNEAVDDLIKRYGNSNQSSFLDIVTSFFRGMYSYPDDVGMALVITAAGLGLLGTRMNQNARRVIYYMDALLCTVVKNPSSLWYFAKKYFEYMQRTNRLPAHLAGMAGRTAGGVLTNMALGRVQRAAGVDPRHVTRVDRIGVSASLFVLAMYGACCHAILDGEQTFMGLLHRMVTGETDLTVGNIPFDPNWQNTIPRDVDELNRELRPWLEEICQQNLSILERSRR